MRIAPPEAPSTGYLFGKGVYFADFIGKSYPYCRPDLSNGCAILVLCEVALGKANEVLRPTYSNVLPAGCHSTHALGCTVPDPAGSQTLGKDVMVPMGPQSSDPKGGMGHNEFIVYNTKQVKMRYIVKVKGVTNIW